MVNIDVLNDAAKDLMHRWEDDVIDLMSKEGAMTLDRYIRYLRDVWIPQNVLSLMNKDELKEYLSKHSRNKTTEQLVHLACKVFTLSDYIFKEKNGNIQFP
jgi:hypothetical protein